MMRIPQSFTHSRGFTLAELLVLVSIVAILVAIMIPVGGVIRDQARGATCASNLGTLMNGMFRYADDHEGEFPAPLEDARGDIPTAMNTWHAYVAPYVEFGSDPVLSFSSGLTWRSNSNEQTVFTCPTSIAELIGLPDFDGGRLSPWYMYGLNAELPSRAGLGSRRSGSNVTVDDLEYPAQTMAILETSDWSAMYSREIGDPAGTGAALIPHGMAANVAFYDGSVRRIPYEELIAYEPDSRFWADKYTD